MISEKALAWWLILNQLNMAPPMEFPNRLTYSLNILDKLVFILPDLLMRKICSNTEIMKNLQNLAYHTSWCELLYFKLGQWRYRIIITVNNDIKKSQCQLYNMVDLVLNQINGLWALEVWKICRSIFSHKLEQNISK